MMSPKEKQIPVSEIIKELHLRFLRYRVLRAVLALQCLGVMIKTVPLLPSKEHVVGWPPIRSYRKNCLQSSKRNEVEGMGMYVKVSVDGAPYLRKIDLKVYRSYPQLLKALENMFKLTIGAYSKREGYNGSDYAPTYEDKDGDWMLVGDVPWEMFISSCKRLRITKGSEARGLGCV
uniref:Auxin-responsive protein n=1 Tax=Gossypium raimondii TaxID=29730 RepID=A0A0D2QTF9_GOSRA|nr:hypothetical protein B456_004G075000 [Gossypium raimondii]